MKTGKLVCITRGGKSVNLDLTDLHAAELVQWASDQKRGGHDGWSWVVMLAVMLKYAPHGMNSAELQAELEATTDLARRQTR